MKICITSNGSAPESGLDPRFGRCAYFVIADLESSELTAVQNEAALSGSGAGIAAGQLMAEKGVKAVVTGNVGPNAMDVLTAAGIGIYRGQGRTVKENIESFKAGKLEKITETVRPHYGKGNRG